MVSQTAWLDRLLQTPSLTLRACQRLNIRTADTSQGCAGIRLQAKDVDEGQPAHLLTQRMR